MGEAPGHASSAIHPLVERAKAFIDERYGERISLSRVASEIGASPDYLSRLFARETGAPLTAYIHRARIAQARRLLSERGPTLAEIAYRVGYQNYRDFYRNFTKYAQASPRRARRALRGEAGPDA